MYIINEQMYRSPNVSSRHGVKVDTLVLHHTGGAFPGCAVWLCNPEAKASAHYIITRSGEIYQLVPPEYCAWHAGRSAFDYNDDGSISEEEKGLNRRSIGIELEYDHRIHEDYTSQQISMLVNLVIHLLKEWEIPYSNVLGHKEIAPGRKWDPGNFDMAAFRQHLYELSMLHINASLSKFKPKEGK